MSQWAKVIERAKDSPNSVRWKEFAYAIEHLGFECIAPRKDSHWMVVFLPDGWQLSVPVHDDHAKGVYIKKILAKIREMGDE